MFASVLFLKQDYSNSVQIPIKHIIEYRIRIYIYSFQKPMINAKRHEIVNSK